MLYCFDFAKNVVTLHRDCGNTLYSCENALFVNTEMISISKIFII